MLLLKIQWMLLQYQAFCNNTILWSWKQELSVAKTYMLLLAKGLRTHRGFDFEGQWDFTTEFTQDCRNRLLGEHRQNLVHIRTQEKGTVTKQDTIQIFLILSRSPQWSCGSAMAYSRLGGTECNSAYTVPFEGDAVSSLPWP